MVISHDGSPQHSCLVCAVCMPCEGWSHGDDPNPVSSRHVSAQVFQALCSNEAQCAVAVEQLRWPARGRCPRGDGAAYSWAGARTQPLFQFSACRHQVSLIAGTVLRGTRLPLNVWFLAIYLISKAKTGLSALALKLRLGVNNHTAWLIHRTLLQALADREERYVFDGQV